MTATERVIRWATAGMVVGVAAVALVGSYELLMLNIRKCTGTARRGTRAPGA
jgi:hypothetical protein